MGLEVEVGELLGISRGNAEQLHEGRIRLDVVLLAETLLLDVGTDELGDLRAGSSGTLTLAEEDTELVAHRDGNLEGDNRRSAVGVLLAGNLALLTGLLDLLGDTLLDTLEVGEHTLESGNLGLNSGLESLELLVPGNLRNSRGSLGNSLGSNNRSSGGLLLNLGLSLLHLLGRGSNGLNLLLSLGGNSLLLSSGLGGSGGSGLGHFARCGGIHLGVFYASLCLYIERRPAGNFLPVVGHKLKKRCAFTFFFEVRS